MDRNKMYRVIYGMARELGISKEELYLILYRDTKKESMKLCTDAELEGLIKFLKLFKDTDALQNKGMTEAQKKKIYALAYSMKWDKDNKSGEYVQGLIDKRLNGICKKICDIDRLKWLSKEQAYKVIEGMKKMAQRAG